MSNKSITDQKNQIFNRDKYPKLGCLSEALRGKFRFVGGAVPRGYEIFGEVWADEFEYVLSCLFPTQTAIADAAKGYAAFSMQSMRLQAAFDREGKYKCKTYEQASNEVYFNESHMMREYLPGLLLSHFLWPHHYRQIQFFKSSFVQAMRASSATDFLEVGIGTGLYSSLMLRDLPLVRGMGMDISPWSKSFTERQLAAMGLANRYEAELRDVTTKPMERKADWLVCVEVLEHLDDPVTFLRGLRRNMSHGAKAFITAALNAAHTDHIYLYRNGAEVLAHLIEAGFTLEQSYTATAYKSVSPGVPVPEAAAFLVY
jgi:2-polyprenyl-3-methyl-5-hydroxy-6-metoxy-1,4-benzoquinol methylase